MKSETIALPCDTAETLRGGRVVDVVTDGTGDARTVTVTTWSETERHRTTVFRAWSDLCALWSATSLAERANATDATRRLERRLRSAIKEAMRIAPEGARGGRR